MESRRNGPQLSSRHDDDDDDQNLIILKSSYGRLLEPRGSKFALLKLAFNAKNFVCRLSRSISSDFGAVHSRNVCGIL